MKSIMTILFAFLIFSCKERIELDLKENADKLVIEAEIDDEPGPYKVRISRSATYNSGGDRIPYNVSLITISDNQGTIDTLRKVNDGLYLTNHLQGKIGNTYYLNVIDQGNSYTAVSTLNSVPNIDSIYGSYFLREDNRNVLIRFQDPASQANYYRYYVKINNREPEIMYVFEDRLINGTTWRLNAFREKYEKGDSVEFFLLGIDKANFQYFNVINQNSANTAGGNQSAAPTNPVSNISGNVLGYFSAHSKKRAKFVFTK